MSCCNASCRDPGRLTVSRVESIYLRTVIKPITLLLKLWLSWKAVVATEELMPGLTRGSSMTSASLSIFRLPYSELSHGSDTRAATDMRTDY